MSKELEIILETSKILANKGKTEVVYLTAEFAPFSNQQKPDLAFIPENQNNLVYFIEYKTQPLSGYSKEYFESIIEHKKFVVDSIKMELRYAFATNEIISAEFSSILSEDDIIVFMAVDNANKLLDEIINWYETSK